MTLPPLLFLTLFKGRFLFKRRGWPLQIEGKRIKANLLSAGNDLLVEVAVNLGTNKTKGKIKTA